jgi:hypothetical protein
LPEDADLPSTFPKGSRHHTAGGDAHAHEHGYKDADAHKAAASLKKSAGGWGTTFSDALRGECRHHVNKAMSTCLGENYTKIVDVHVMQMRLHIYVRNVHAPHIHLPEHSSENVGIGHVLGNKGGQVAKFQLYGQSFGFVSCHLPAHEGEKHALERDRAVADIMRGTKLMYKHLDVASQFSHVFWMGDLNYRVNIKTIPEYELDFEKEPHSKRTKKANHEKEWSKVSELVAAEEFDVLHKADELSTRMADKKVFVGWSTQPPNFKPTFKVKKAYDLAYNNKRVPSWCDRVLWKSLPGFASFITPTLYESCPGYKTSDHKPVRAGFTVRLPVQLQHPAERTEIVHLIFTDLSATVIKKVWQDHHSNMDTPDPFLKFCPDPVDLEIAHITDKQLRQGIKMGKPGHTIKSHYVGNTYEPTFKKDSTFVIAVKIDTLENLHSCHIHICCLDNQVLTKQRPIGAMSLSLGRIHDNFCVSGGQPMPVDSVLVRNGVECGTISGSVRMERP